MQTNLMTPKTRVHAALDGKPVDHFPVTVLYSQLYHLDHFTELTGRPAWEIQRWLHADPEEHLVLFRRMVEQAPFEIVQPQYAPSRRYRESLELIEHDGHHFLCNRKTGELIPLDAGTVSGHATDYHANETQYVFDQADVNARLQVTPAEALIATGMNDYIEAAATALGDEYFILSGGVIGVMYSAHSYVGQTNLLAMLAEQPDFIDYLCGKILEQNIEQIRALAAAGGDGIYIDDATTTCDMISVPHFERFSLPYMQQMVQEIHRLGQKAIIIYFGGIADRLEQIAAMGADGLLFETSMKGYVNDVGEIATCIGDRVSLFGNIDPIAVLQDASDDELTAEIRRQVAAGRQARGFLLSTGSPITPATPLARVRTFIELGRSLGRLQESC